MPDHIKKKIKSKNEQDGNTSKPKAAIKVTNRFAGLSVDDGADHDSGMSRTSNTNKHPADPLPQISKDSYGTQDTRPSERKAAGVEVSGMVVPTSSALQACVAGDIHDRDIWLIDSGCNTHIVNDKKWFITFNDKSTSSIGTADGNLSLPTFGSGRIVIKCDTTDGVTNRVLLRHALYAPSARCNLLSLCKLLQEGDTKQEADPSSMRFYKNGREMGYTKPVNGLYHLAVSTQSSIGTTPIAAMVDWDHPVWKWHRRLGHLSLQNMRNLLKFSDGIDLTDQQIKDKLGVTCPVCATTRALVYIPRDPVKRRAQVPGEVIHMDTWGKYAIEGWDGTRYFLFLTDDATRFTWAIRYSKKSEMPDVFRKLYNKIETSLNIKIRNYRCDGEFSPGPVGRWLEKRGVGMELTQPDVHYQNGVAERANRTMRERSAAILQEDDVLQRLTEITKGRTQELLRETKRPENLWPEAVEHAIWHKNRAPARALRKKEKKTPWEALYGTKPSLDREKIWGSRVYVTFSPENLIGSPKLHVPRGWFGYWVGRWSESVDKVYSLEKHKVYKIGVARVDDGQGLDDPQPNLTYTDRVPVPDGLLPENVQDLDFEDEDPNMDTTSEVEGDLDDIETDIPEDSVQDSKPTVSVDDAVTEPTAVAEAFEEYDRGSVPLENLNNQMDEVSINDPQDNTIVTQQDHEDSNGPGSGIPDGESSSEDEEPVRSRFFANMAIDHEDPEYEKSDLESEAQSSMGEASDTDDEDEHTEPIVTTSTGRKQPQWIKTAAGPVRGPLQTLRPDPTKCDNCFRQRTSCDWNTAKGAKCTPCRKKGYRCIGQTEETKAVIPMQNRTHKWQSSSL